MNFKKLKDIVDGLDEMIGDRIKHEDFEINFKTFDERFEENADEYQEPTDITSVQFDILNFTNATITIERKTGAIVRPQINK